MKAIDVIEDWLAARFGDRYSKALLTKSLVTALDAAGYVIIERRLLDLRHPMSGVQFHTPSEDEK